uniref:Putative secreted peptide n=1 Tax=Anopheles braziliensis TaxID=58242 RepID=A0A2M3ZV23_9DIPT
MIVCNVTLLAGAGASVGSTLAELGASSGKAGTSLAEICFCSDRCAVAAAAAVSLLDAEEKGVATVPLLPLVPPFALALLMPPVMPSGW